MAEVFVTALELYAAAGFAFAMVFVTVGVHRVDDQAKGTGVAFRLIILPGAAALWPLLLTRWIRGAEPPLENNAHRRGAMQGGMP